MSPFSSRLELRLGLFAGRRREPGTTFAATPVAARQPSGRTQADFTREVPSSHTRSARSLVK